MRVPSSSRIRSLVIAAAVLMVVLVQLFAVLLTGLSARNDTIRVGRQAINRVGDTTIESILRHVEPAEQSIGVTGRLLGDGLLMQDAPDLERYLFTQLAVMPQMTGTFVGYPDGSFVFVSRNGDGFTSKRIETTGGRVVDVTHYDSGFRPISTEQPAEDTYDPRTRPWYNLAAGSDSVRWTDPYVFFSSGKPGVTAAQSVRSADGQLFAVTGVDVELTGLGEFLNDLPVARSGEAFVVSGSSVVAAPGAYDQQTIVDDSGSLRLLQIDELGVSALGEAADGEVRSMEVDGEKELVLHRMFPADHGLDWGLVIRAPESDFVGEINQQQRAVNWILIFGGLIIAAGMMLLLRVTRPVRALQHMASTDSLTGLANRRAVDDRGGQLIAAAAHEADLVSALVVDLDRFKALNDRLGHEAGDQALRLVADHLRSSVGPNSVVGRLGGDEFVVISSVTSPETAKREVTEMFDGLVSKLAAVGDDAIRVEASAGFTMMPSSGDGDQPVTVGALIRDADAALIDVKRHHRGSLAFASRLQPV